METKGLTKEQLKQLIKILDDNNLSEYLPEDLAQALKDSLIEAEELKDEAN